ncbi:MULTISPECIES: HalOD1 output domain-containing protein [Halorussus]|uniref:HalOD1 output domain-containing protein n=1 Tax=Halorussus TaxID=1070314 RepID=UPI00209C94B8|nr:HalOD1 output domain-containing protein [Halorussus vallis]USZ77412.1 hypothetical protein NGM07_08780 [Halorussus vallis]
MPTTAKHSSISAEHRSRYDPAQTDEVSVKICEALADVEGVDITELDVNLYEQIDVDAVDALFQNASPDQDWHLELTVEQYTVSVHSDGRIYVSPRI